MRGTPPWKTTFVGLIDLENYLEGLLDFDSTVVRSIVSLLSRDWIRRDCGALCKSTRERSTPSVDTAIWWPSQEV